MTLASLMSLRPRRMVWGVTSKCAASSSTVTRPAERSRATISFWRREKDGGGPSMPSGPPCCDAEVERDRYAQAATAIGPYLVVEPGWKQHHQPGVRADGFGAAHRIAVLAGEFQGGRIHARGRS